MENILSIDPLNGKKYKATLSKNGKEEEVLEGYSILHIQEYAKDRDEQETDTSRGMYLEDGSIIDWELEEIVEV